MESLFTNVVTHLPSRITSTQFTMGGQKLVIFKSQRRSLQVSHCFKTTVSCSAAEPETLKIMQTIIAKQLSINETTIAPTTKFVDLGADSLDTAC
ncbi:hypothetical protein Lser_V15G01498 [Lactuca serriola]